MTKKKPNTRSCITTNSSDSEPESTRIEELTTTIKELQKSINFISAQLDDIRKENKELKKILKEDGREKEIMKERISHLEETMERNEREKIKNNIIITGVEKQENEGGRLADIVRSIAGSMNVKLETADLIACNRKEGRTDCPPIIVQLAHKELKQKILDARRTIGSIKTRECNIKGKNNEIYLNEQLTTQNTALFYQARLLRKEKQYRYVWTRDGNIYLKKADTTQKIKIKNIEDLRLVH